MLPLGNMIKTLSDLGTNMKILLSLKVQTLHNNSNATQQFEPLRNNLNPAQQFEPYTTIRTLRNNSNPTQQFKPYTTVRTLHNNSGIFKHQCI